MPTKGLERLTQHVLSNSKEARQIDLAYANEKGKAGRPIVLNTIIVKLLL